MKIYTLYTAEHKILYQYFLKTIPKNFSVIARLSPLKGGSTRTAEFANINRQKIFYLRNVVRKNLGLNIMWCDVDVVFLGNNFENFINSELENFDMVFQDNGSSSLFKPYYNVGVWGIKCSDKIVSFFDKLCSYSESDYYQRIEQNLVNSELFNFDIKRSILPHSFFATHFQKGWEQIPQDGYLVHFTNKIDAGTKLSSLNELVEWCKSNNKWPEFIKNFNAPNLDIIDNPLVEELSEKISIHGNKTTCESFELFSSGEFIIDLQE